MGHLRIHNPPSLKEIIVICLNINIALSFEWDFLKNLKLIDTCIFQFAAEYVLIQAVSFLSKNAREPNELTNAVGFW